MGMKFTDYPIRGIDISEFNGAIDFDSLKETGANFCIIRAGYGKTTDKGFLLNWKQCKGKMHRSAYWYLDYYSNWYFKDSSVYGLSDADWGKKQAEKAWEFWKHDPEGIVFLDIENYSQAPKMDTCWDRVLTMMDAFYAKLDALSKKTNGLYASYGWLDLFPSRFKNRPLWVAWYKEDIALEKVRELVVSKGWTNFWMWQYASDGDINNDTIPDGKEYGTQLKTLDLNIWMKSAEEFYRLVGGNMRLDIAPLSQQDLRWASIKLGTSKSTIGSHGCLMTCATMLVRFLLGINITPADMNAWLIANGGYHNYNLFVWAILNKYDSKISFGYRYNGALLDKIDEQLAKGMPVIVNVDGIPASSAIDEHWVLIIGKENGKYIINDPIDGVQFPFDNRYGDPRSKIYVVCTYNFSGTVPPPVIEPPVEEAEMLYQVKVKITNLVIRSGAGAIYPIVKRYASGVLPIYEEKNGYGKIAVGQWISLSPEFVERVDDRLDILWGAHPELH